MKTTSINGTMYAYDLEQLPNNPILIRKRNGQRTYDYVGHINTNDRLESLQKDDTVIGTFTPDQSLEDIFKSEFKELLQEAIDDNNMESVIAISTSMEELKKEFELLNDDEALVRYEDGGLKVIDRYAMWWHEDVYRYDIAVKVETPEDLCDAIDADLEDYSNKEINELAESIGMTPADGDEWIVCYNDDIKIVLEEDGARILDYNGEFDEE